MEGKRATYSREDFLAVFKEVHQELIEELPREFEMPPDAVNWVDKLIVDSVPGGKLNRGLTVVHTLQALSSEPLTPAQLKQAAVLGWCIEWLQGFFLVADDLMDSSQTRRGEPCWYLKPAPKFEGQKVGLVAVNDSFILEAHVFRLLKKHFRSHPNYIDLVDLFHEVAYQTELGQLLDLTSQPAGDKVDLSLFTLDTYLKIDDYLDCYGDPVVIGKIGRDIEEKKCGWLVCQALLRATPEQKQLIQTQYGKEDPECVLRIKALYKELDLENVYKQAEEQSYVELKGQIEAVRHAPLQHALNLLLAKIYKRSA
ncbi:farnesyl pyrophosphate synthetase [Acanthamoeba castellanii str. Neff]|uniref:Farnesyl pyrophosphate synthetase n=1 Tax=Acanthamoeba castellanii (strain ATCC 30010 / Neff) TaxID=1257118 RepID=L8HA89_ACACF|nr:farnesyl pyrophosphate synthetase [Acanthamoeba castellanii str. Neff]ELR21361.1 farnesyl pyrophosphate synthetase [Acanthamoeba castellanii str. Neff]